MATRQFLSLNQTERINIRALHENRIPPLFIAVRNKGWGKMRETTAITLLTTFSGGSHDY